MYLPQLNVISQSRLFTDTFLGYNHNLKIADGEWYDETNITSSSYPLFSQRDKRRLITTIDHAQCMIYKNGYLYYVDGEGLYTLINTTLGIVTTQITGVVLSTEPDQLPKKFVSMGAYIIVFPDGVYVNTADTTEYGNIDASFWTDVSSSVTYEMCKADGTAYDLSGATVSDVQPTSPTNGDYWIDTSAEKHVLKQYASTTKIWTSIATVYIKIGCTGIGADFSKYDGVSISGCAYTGSNEYMPQQIAALNTANIIYDRGTDYIVVAGIIDQTYTQSTGYGTVKVERKAPEFGINVLEHDNRLWAGGELENAIYACKLGDFKNWNCFMGLSTDSYAVTVGTDGRFTGAISYKGYPTLFKENCMHIVYGSLPSDFQLQTKMCRGVQEGSENSLVIVNEILYYKSNFDVCAYDGSQPTTISNQLGTEKYTRAAAGVLGAKYYISMKDSASAWHLFVYDTSRGLWHREDSTSIYYYAQTPDDLLFTRYSATGLTYELVSVNGTYGTLESDIAWSASSGIMGYEYPDAKYISRFHIRAKLATGATLSLSIEYDSAGGWVDMGTYTGTALTQTITIPVIPRRCDHLRLKISGTGDVKIYSIARILEQGGDI